jgi:hemerythrin-like domain-containing protein
MSHDIFESERYRVERVLEILEHAVSRLGGRTQVSVSLLKDAVAFLRGAEETAFEAAQEDDSEPTLSGCLEYYTAARRILAGMQETLQDLELGDAAAATRFARSAREYIFLRRDHLRLDDRLFARAQVRGRALDGSREPVELVEPEETRRLYDRLVEAAAILGLGVPSAFPTVRASRRLKRNGA